MKETLPASPINKNRLKKIGNDPVATAKAVKLVYVNSNSEGITRIKNGKGFIYQYRNKQIKDKSQLQRIRSLVIPPAWSDVWICTLANGHLQATGADLKKRKQYRYHPEWNALRNQTKFYKLLELGKALPIIRKQVQKDLSLPGLPKNKVLAAVVSLMEKTGIRTGNGFYEKLYGSFGLTTLKDKHVSIKGATIKFTFRGKKGVEHAVSLKNKKLSSIVQRCRDIPGKELFQYIDEEGQRQSIESGMVNEYIKQIAGDEFTAKDFRTWCGSVTALQAFKEIGPFEARKQAKENIISVLDRVSSQLGNTRNVCKKYYVHPSLPELYETGKMEKWIEKMQTTSTNDETDLQPAEKTLVNILESK